MRQTYQVKIKTVDGLVTIDVLGIRLSETIAYTQFVEDGIGKGPNRVLTHLPTGQILLRGVRTTHAAQHVVDAIHATFGQLLSSNPAEIVATFVATLLDRDPSSWLRAKLAEG
jgi:hypothetical protein